MMVLRHPHLGQRHLPPEVAADSGKIAVIAATTTPVGVTSPLQIARSAPDLLMPVPLRHRAVARQHQHHHLGQHHLPLGVAANSGQTVAIAATTTPVGATSLLQIAKFAPEASTPVPLHHRAGDAPAPVSTLVRAVRLAARIHASTQLVQPESAERPDMDWAMVQFGSLRAVILASFCCLRTSEIQCRSTMCMCEEPFRPIVEMHGVSPIGSTDRGSIVPSMSTA